MTKLIHKLKRRYKQFKCFMDRGLSLCMDRATTCKGVPGMELCSDCKDREPECIGCDGWSECTKRSHICNKGY